MECWGANDRGQADAPGGTFEQIAAGTGFSCGVRSDDAVECWGVDRPVSEDQILAVMGRIEGATDLRLGSFKTVSIGSRHSCGIRADDTIECWGVGHGGLLNAPSGGFSSVSAARNHSCGVHTNGTVECWGLDYPGLLNAPGGQFTTVSASPSHSCAIRTNGRVECWGTVRPAPEGVTLAQQGDSRRPSSG